MFVDFLLGAVFDFNCNMKHDKELNESQSCFKRVTVCGAICIRIVP